MCLCTRTDLAIKLKLELLFEKVRELLFGYPGADDCRAREHLPDLPWVAVLLQLGLEIPAMQADCCSIAAWGRTAMHLLGEVRQLTTELHGISHPHSGCPSCS